MKLILLRHGQTLGNRERRYVGRTDEGITEQAEQELLLRKETFSGEPVACLFSSPLRRCLQTAQLLFPDIEIQQEELLKECDFGAFEYKNYEQLDGNPAYQRFIDTGGESGFPGGETKKQFTDRSTEGFCRCLRKVEEQGFAEESTCVFVVHGGTIMAVLDRFSSPHREYYDWQVGPGEGFEMQMTRSAQGILLEEIRRV